MSPLYLFNGRLLISDNKLAASASCCCNETHGVPCCYCNPSNVTFEGLWTVVESHLNYLNIQCSGQPIVCGEFLSSVGNPPPRNAATCCQNSCYNLWNWLLESGGVKSEHLNKTPAELDVLYPGGYCGIRQVWSTNQGLGGYAYIVPHPNDLNFDKLKTQSNPQHTGVKCTGWMSDDGNRIFFGGAIGQWSSASAFAISSGTINSSAIPDPVKILFEAGTNEPCAATGFYQNLADCRNSYPGVWKNNPEISGYLINAVSGDIQGTTTFFIQTDDTLETVPCIGQRFGNQTSFPPVPITEVPPYGILTDQIDPGCENLGGWNYQKPISMTVGYKFQLTWDDPNSTDPAPVYYDVINKWDISYKRNSFNSPLAWSFSGLDNNYTNNMPVPTGIVSDLTFNPATTGFNFDIQWSEGGVTIGPPNSCSFMDETPSNDFKEKSRVAPSLTLSYTGIGTGCSFTPVITESTNEDGYPQWSISSVTVSGSGINYTNDETLQINTSPGDIIEQSGLLKIVTYPDVVTAPNISGSVNAANTSSAILNLIYENIPGDDSRWRINNIAVVDGGSGYADGVYPINFVTYSGTIQVVPATGIAITERTAPIFSGYVVTQSGVGASVSIIPEEGSINGQRVWSLEFFQGCDLNSGAVVQGGSSYTGFRYDQLTYDQETGLLIPPAFDPNLDHLVVTVSNGVIDTHTWPGKTQTSTNTWKTNFVIDSNGSIQETIFSHEIFLCYECPGVPMRTTAYYNPTGKIEVCRLNNSSSLNGIYPCSPRSLPGNNVSFMGSYYTPDTTPGALSGVIVENSGVYYKEATPHIIPLEGPCISGLDMTLWHPGPCGITSGLIPETGYNTAWSGRYYGNIEQFIYEKGFVYTLPGQQLPIGGSKDSLPCYCTPGVGHPCQIITNIGLLVGKRDAILSLDYGRKLQDYGMFATVCGSPSFHMRDNGIWATQDISNMLNCNCSNPYDYFPPYYPSTSWTGSKYMVIGPSSLTGFDSVGASGFCKSKAQILQELDYSAAQEFDSCLNTAFAPYASNQALDSWPNIGWEC